MHEGFQLQIKAIEHLMKYRVNVHPACMISFSPTVNIITLRKRLRAVNPVFEDFEVEELILYPSVEKRLKELRVDYLTGHKPDSIPDEQI